MAVVVYLNGLGEKAYKIAFDNADKDGIVRLFAKHLGKGIIE